MPTDPLARPPRELASAESLSPQPLLTPAEPPPPRPGLVSVLVSCLGQLEYTRLCVARLLRHAGYPFELIALDAGSLDGTAAFLAGIQTAAPVRVEVIRTRTDQGLPAACREALARARGDYLVLLNNDTLITADWLGQLVALARLSPQIGLVGPMSNHATPPQLVEDVPYRVRWQTPRAAAADHLVELLDPVFEELDRFAHTWREQHRGQWLETDRLGGFCLLLKRAVLDRLGPLQAQAGLEVFDTTALCRQARQAGYTLAVCHDLFVHHCGSRTFAHGGPALERQGGHTPGAASSLTAGLP